MNGAQAAPTPAETESVRDVWRLRQAVRLHRRPLDPGDMHGLRRLGPALTCGLTGTVTVACLGTAGGCGYCGIGGR